MKNNITFVIGKLSTGGAERVVSILANLFSRKGYKVYIYMLFGTEVIYEIEPNVTIEAISHRSKFRIVRMIYKITTLRKKIKKNHSLKVISFLYDCNIYTIISTIMLKKVDVIVSERNNPYTEPNNYWLKKIRNFSYLFSDKVVFQTEEAKNYFRQSIVRKGTIIMNPLNPNIGDPIFSDRSNVIIGIGRLEDQKDFQTLIKAFNIVQLKHKDYTLNIYGDGPLIKELMGLCVQLGIDDKVVFKGFSKDIYSEIKKSKIFVLTSKFEGISNALIECMSLAIPSISTDCPIYGSRMLIDNGYNGFLCPVGDFQEISNKICHIIENPDLYDFISTNSYKIREKLKPEYIFEQWEKVIYDINNKK